MDDRLGSGNHGAVGYMIGAVVCFSLIPLTIEFSHGSGSPFLFNSLLRIGVAISCMIFVLAAYRRNFRVLILDWRILLVMGPRLLSLAILFTVFSNFNFALFAWSSRLVDISVVAILYEVWPILTIAFMAILLRGERRYERIPLFALVLLLVCLLGFSFVVFGQKGGFSAVFQLDSDSSFALIGGVLWLWALR